jgi:hypothetical protein
MDRMYFWISGTSSHAFEREYESNDSLGNLGVSDFQDVGWVDLKVWESSSVDVGKTMGWC